MRELLGTRNVERRACHSLPGFSVCIWLASISDLTHPVLIHSLSRHRRRCDDRSLSCLSSPMPPLFVRYYGHLLVVVVREHFVISIYDDWYQFPSIFFVTFFQSFYISMAAEAASAPDLLPKQAKTSLALGHRWLPRILRYETLFTYNTPSIHYSPLYCSDPLDRAWGGSSDHLPPPHGGVYSSLKDCHTFKIRSRIMKRPSPDRKTFYCVLGVALVTHKSLKERISLP